MVADPNALRLAEAMVSQATSMRFGQLVVDVTTRYVVTVRDGQLMDAALKEVHPRVTVEQLRKATGDLVG